MNDKLIELIRYGSEDHSLDFKELQYSMEKHDKKNEILKDISAMANHPSEEQKFIVIGVKEINGAAAEFNNVLDLIDEAKYQQFVNSNIDPPINFEYKSIFFNGFNLAYFRIYNNKNRPYLFKKDLVNPLKPEKNEFRAGDGYIRQGTSTKKMTREDFELIYKTRLSGRDRKSDIKVTPYIAKSRDKEINSCDLSCFDVLIENLSSKSIDLDIEVSFLKSNKFNIIEETELKKQLENERSEILKYQRTYPFMQAVSNVPISFNISVEDMGSHIMATRDKLRGERTAISIPQHDKERHAFCGELIIVCDSSALIRGEITIRSDDFVDGAWIVPFSIKHH